MDESPERVEPVPGEKPRGPVLAEEDLRLLFESALDAVFVADVAGILVDANPAACDLVGYARREMVGMPAERLLHAEERERLIAVREGLLRGEGSLAEWNLIRADGAPITVEFSSRILPNGRWYAFGRDVTRRRRADMTQRLLARAGAALTTSLDAEETLAALAELALADLCDGCAVDLATPEGGLDRVVLVTRDPAKAELVRELERRWPTPLDAPAGNVMAYRTGDAQLFPTIPEDVLLAISTDEEHLDLWRRIGMESALSVPITARGRVYGVLTLVSHTEQRRYGPEDVPVAQELAHRAALALDNARLYEAAGEARDEAERAAARLGAQVAETERATEALQKSERQFRSLADSIPQLAWMTDAEGSIFWYNQRWYDYTGTRPQEVLGWGWRSVHHPGHLERVERRFREAVAAGTPWEDTFPLRARDGAYRWFLSRALPMRDEGGKVVGWFGTNTDVTEQRGAAAERERLLDREREARAAAEEASQAKSQFLSVMSHELRTPLSGVIGYADLLDQGVWGELTEPQRKHLGRITSAAWHLVSIIDEILTFTRMEAGREAVRRELTDVCAIAAETTDLVFPDAAARGLRLDVRLPEEACRAETDPGKLRQILLNLLGNAVKFTDEGEVAVEVERDAEWLLVSVRDTGPGIPPDQLERIFEPFTQLDATSTRRQGGTGLGLTVSRKLARLLGGDVEVESRPGEGSRFTVRLPVRPPAD